MAQVKTVKLVNATGNVFRCVSDPRKAARLMELGYKEVAEEVQQPEQSAPTAGDPEKVDDQTEREPAEKPEKKPKGKKQSAPTAGA